MIRNMASYVTSPVAVDDRSRFVENSIGPSFGHELSPIMVRPTLGGLAFCPLYGRQEMKSTDGLGCCHASIFTRYDVLRRRMPVSAVTTGIGKNKVLIFPFIDPKVGGQVCCHLDQSISKSCIMSLSSIPRCDGSNMRTLRFQAWIRESPPISVNSKEST